MSNFPEITYSISDVALQTNVSHRQIRNWESKGYIPAPLRIVYGQRAHRRYTPADVQLITTIKEFLNEGFTLPMAAEKAKGKKEENNNDEKK